MMQLYENNGPGRSLSSENRKRKKIQDIFLEGASAESRKSIEVRIVHKFWKTKPCLVVVQCLKSGYATPILYKGGVGV